MKKQENPFEPRGSASVQTPRTIFTGRKLVFVASFLGGLFGLLFPAVEAARETSGVGPFFPKLMWLHQQTFPLPIIVGIVVSSLIASCCVYLVRAKLWS